MAESVGQIRYEITVDEKGLVTGIKNAEKEVTSSVKKQEDVLSRLGKAVVTAFSVKAVKDFATSVVNAYAEQEQLIGGVQKIFDKMDYNKIAQDAKKAYKTMNISASQYLSQVNLVGAAFASTMGQEEGYETAKKGMQAIADYASGTGVSVDLLMDKFKAITRSTSSYLSIADQFGATLLPQTTEGFLEQAQAAGYLSDEYKKLSEVPIDEYQRALTSLIDENVKKVNLAGNAYHESETTVSGSINAMKAAWENFTASLGSGDTDAIRESFDDFAGSLKDVADNVLPVIGNIIGGIFEAVGEFFSINSPYIDALTVALTTIATFLLPSIAVAIGTTIKNAVVGLFGIITANPVLAAISAIVGVLVLVARHFDEIKEIAKGVFDFLGNGFKALGDAFSKAGGSIVETAVTAWNGIKNAFSGVANFFGTVFGNAWRAVLNVFSTGGSIFKGIADAITGAFKNIVNHIIGGINTVVAIPFNAINAALSGIRNINILGLTPFSWIGTISVPQIPQLATGGIVQATNGGQIITAGEAGEDEWVVPEGKMESLIEQFNNRTNGVTINLYGTFATSESEQRRVAEQIYEALQDVNKSRLGAYL